VIFDFGGEKSFNSNRIFYPTRQRILKKQILHGLLVILLFCFMANTSVLLTSSATTKTHAALASYVNLTVDYGNTTQDMFSDLSGNTVFDILNQTTSVTFIQYAYGKFITSINGVENNANDNEYYWQYWVNNELAPVAADNYILSDSDQVLWKYCAPEITPTTPPTPGPEILLGVGIIGAVGVIVIIAASIVYLKIR
jgi:hypothetical protein